MGQSNNKLCASCGDPFEVVEMPRWVRDLCMTNEEVERGSLWGRYCDECAREKAGFGFSTQSPLQHGTGGGRRVIRSSKPQT